MSYRPEVWCEAHRVRAGMGQLTPRSTSLLSLGWRKAGFTEPLSLDLGPIEGFGGSRFPSSPLRTRLPTTWLSSKKEFSVQLAGAQLPPVFFGTQAKRLNQAARPNLESTTPSKASELYDYECSCLINQTLNPKPSTLNPKPLTLNP